jgi:hypothetical protein
VPGGQCLVQELCQAFDPLVDDQRVRLILSALVVEVHGGHPNERLARVDQRGGADHEPVARVEPSQAGGVERVEPEAPARRQLPDRTRVARTSQPHPHPLATGQGVRPIEHQRSRIHLLQGSSFVSSPGGYSRDGGRFRPPDTGRRHEARRPAIRALAATGPSHVGRTAFSARRLPSKRHKCQLERALSSPRRGRRPAGTVMPGERAPSSPRRDRRPAGTVVPGRRRRPRRRRPRPAPRPPPGQRHRTARHPRPRALRISSSRSRNPSSASSGA